MSAANQQLVNFILGDKLPERFVRDFRGREHDRFTQKTVKLS